MLGVRRCGLCPAIPRRCFRRGRWLVRASRERLDEGAGRRLTAIVAGAGYGKSTLVARWADARTDTTWYSLDAIDRSLSYLVRGVATALEPFIGGAPADLRAVIAAGASSADEGDPARADAVADLMCELLAERLTGDRVIVIDDLQKIVGSVQAIRFIENLLRGAPPVVHLVLVKPRAVPLGRAPAGPRGCHRAWRGPARLHRGRDGGAPGAPRGRRPPLLPPRLHAVTSGWPAAVQPGGGRRSSTSHPPRSSGPSSRRLGRPGGTPVRLASRRRSSGTVPESVLALPAQRRRELEWFDGSLLEAVGVKDAPRSWPSSEGGRCSSISTSTTRRMPSHKLLRGVIVEQLPMTATETADLNRRAARWFEERGRLRGALGACLATAIRS